MVNIGVVASHGGTVLQAVLDAAGTGHATLHTCVVVGNNSGSGAAVLDAGERRSGVSRSRTRPLVLERSACRARLRGTR